MSVATTASIKRSYRHFIAIALAVLLGGNGSTPLAAQDLQTNQSIALLTKLSRAMADNDLTAIIESRKLAVALVVFEKQGSYSLAMLNGHQMLYAASLPKIAILLGAMVADQEGDLSIDAELQQDLNDMIRWSCNACASRALARVGRERLLSILQRPEFQFYDQNNNGGLWVGKDYAEEEAYHRDPLMGLSHAATVFQVARFYFRLEEGSLVDAEHAGMMKDILGDPGIAHKFVKALGDRPDVNMLRKSGSWKNFHADSALVYAAGRRYIMVAMLEHENGEELLQSIGSSLHEIVMAQ